MSIAHSKFPIARQALIRRWVILLALAAVAAALVSCSTTEGFGKDVKNLGGGIEDSAAKNK
jgi:predicted small secreted protein